MAPKVKKNTIVPSTGVIEAKAGPSNSPSVKSEPVSVNDEIDIKTRALFFFIPYAIFFAGYMLARVVDPLFSVIVRELVRLYADLANHVLFDKLLKGNTDTNTTKVMLDVIRALANVTVFGVIWILSMSGVVSVWYPIPKTRFAWGLFGVITCLMCIGLAWTHVFLTAWKDSILNMK